MTGEITIKINSEPVRRIIDKYIIKLKDINIYAFNKSDYVKVFVNGDYLGFTGNPEKIMEDFKIKKIRRVIHYQTSSFWNIPENFIMIWSDEGRLIRPLLKVKDNKLKFNDEINKLLAEKKYKYIDLISSIRGEPCIEYVDPYETNNVIIATYTKDLIDKKEIIPIVKFIHL